MHTARHEHFGSLGMRLQDVTNVHVGMDFGRYCVAKEQTQIVFDRGDACDAEVFNQNLGDILGQERGQGGAEVDILDTQVQQS